MKLYLLTISRLRIIVAAFLLNLILVCSQSQAITFEFDYTYDTGNFFGSVGSAQRNALEEAASFFETHLADNLSAITPGGGNTWSATFYDPTDTSSIISQNNLSIAEDTLLVFVGSENRGTGNLAIAAPGGIGGGGGSPDFVNDVLYRDQAGASSGTDFGPWGGSISFNDNSDINWNFDTSVQPAGNEFDFYSTALHEIAHVLGLGTAASYLNLVTGSGESKEFTGANAVAEFGSNVPLTADDHVDDGTMSTVFGTGTSQTSLMAATASEGDPRYFATDLDMAMLEDTGWEVVPEPGSGMLLLSGCGYLLLRRRRRRQEDTAPAAA